MSKLIPIEIIENKIFIIRGQKVMLDSDLAQLYEVETRIINRNVKRNINRFPEDFMFQLTGAEWKTLKSQIGISNEKKGGRRFTPYVFTEYGILMLSNVLSSNRAITVSIQIIRVFEKLRQFALNQNQLTERIASLEQAFMNYAKENNEDTEDLRRAINYLLDITKPATIGFKG
jgi:hypothetical protein